MDKKLVIISLFLVGLLVVSGCAQMSPKEISQKKVDFNNLSNGNLSNEGRIDYDEFFEIFRTATVYRILNLTEGDNCIGLCEENNKECIFGIKEGMDQGDRIMSCAGFIYGNGTINYRSLACLCSSEPS
jgi:hypothetical protein